MRNDKSPSKVITISLDQETLEILEDMSCCSGRSRSYVIREAIRSLAERSVDFDYDSERT